jgi:hypothetical protein
MNPFQLAGKFMYQSGPIQTGLNEAAKVGLGHGFAVSTKDPANQLAGYLFGIPYLSLPAVVVTTINAGATAPGTLDEARRMGLYK